mmetsp:Transcript_6115/g.13528  ORF Transcript_6115/g.13528 Transcript_6115/m.13528 type:complete len:450 (+) Transcript_6115:261-1610(+)
MAGCSSGSAHRVLNRREKVFGLKAREADREGVGQPGPHARPRRPVRGGREGELRPVERHCSCALGLKLHQQAPGQRRKPCPLLLHRPFLRRLPHGGAEPRGERDVLGPCTHPVLLGSAVHDRLEAVPVRQRPLQPPFHVHRPDALRGAELVARHREIIDAHRGDVDRDLADALACVRVHQDPVRQTLLAPLAVQVAPLTDSLGDLRDVVDRAHLVVCVHYGHQHCFGPEGSDDGIRRDPPKGVHLDEGDVAAVLVLKPLEHLQHRGVLHGRGYHVRPQLVDIHAAPPERVAPHVRSEVLREEAAGALDSPLDHHVVRFCPPGREDDLVRLATDRRSHLSTGSLEARLRDATVVVVRRGVPPSFSKHRKHRLEGHRIDWCCARIIHVDGSFVRTARAHAQRRPPGNLGPACSPHWQRQRRKGEGGDCVNRGGEDNRAERHTPPEGHRAHL